jgi:hypothetical protein
MVPMLPEFASAIVPVLLKVEKSEPLDEGDMEALRILTSTIRGSLINFMRGIN